ncbi:MULTISPECIES: leucyl/phenylalanyl-tRNA--protein transferase [Elizabethkingia]|uniref:Leucyl/phenylalanyl-tRNA--protein transferase n=1 Tax=Elizabethkingia anophelis TaxID=1117645 RepID=A0A494J712_9FLAO|nr:MULTISPECIES: leucyl/phenylalanyl-tRNA--protein transferase [Elizabethkingia]AQX49912.1 leucyl/phenylalanyl-tRNA--protein transferase [Elizabethkingia anophelis]EJC8059560.1 leucyl/phenylalanyl-tRNA--protein transferase [Elizabethkingia anophelis]MCL1642017.1 leucyl/phenylalanyl-tRNA--protein transferase [Elizabethkingia anophelis]MCL1644563.1 leucyl/phenylalanyl-tRNA--protein transferase [Elizabethkingia anophelis]MCT3630134.1 leucyl/phenylalanyl-tRNA--protein transferase [Elizabethkingia 
MYQLDPHDISFPDPALYNPEEGLMAFGGDLSVERIWFAYQLGIFPWFNEGEEILWWCPDPRFVLFPNEIRISKSMRKVFRDETFSFTENQCFTEVIRNCKDIYREDQDGTWITNEMEDAYIELHRLGKAKSIEVWQDEELVGGLYGLDLGNVFCGESMFAKVSNASKAGFIYFAQKYQGTYDVIDCQVYTAHLESLGARMIDKLDYLNFLK